MKNLSAIIVAYMLLVFSCETEAPEIKNSLQIIEFANNVDTAGVFPLVEQLTSIHLSDTPVSSEGFPTEDLYPSEHLTRNKAVGFVSAMLADMGYDVDTVILGNEPLLTYNVVAEWKGTSKVEEVVLFGAHLDAFYGGADDNSSAIAALLEIARAARNFSFERTIRFVAFDLEERGSLGSTRYIEAGYADDVVSAVILDLIGYSSEEPGSQKNIMGIKMPDTGNYIVVAGNKNSAQVVQQVVSVSHTSKISKAVGILAPDDGTFFLSSAFMRSDNGLFWHKGVPAVLFSDGANFRNSNYHKSTDLPSTLNRTFLNNNT